MRLTRAVELLGGRFRTPTGPGSTRFAQAESKLDETFAKFGLSAAVKTVGVPRDLHVRPLFGPPSKI